jgi:hypothetical protein
MLLTLIREVPGSNFDSDTGYSEVHGFSQFLQANAEIVPLGHNHLLQKPFEFVIHLSP